MSPWVATVLVLVVVLSVALTARVLVPPGRARRPRDGEPAVSEGAAPEAPAHPAPVSTGPGPRETLPDRADLVGALAAPRGGPRGAVAVVDLSALLRVVGVTLGQDGADRAHALAVGRLAATVTGPDAVAGTGPVARVGPDALAVALDAADPAAVRAITATLRGRLEAPAVVDGLPFAPPVAIGTALAAEVPPGPPAERAAVLLDRADTARRAAAGGREVRAWDPALGERAERRVDVLRGFADAVAGGGLGVHFQPVVELRGRAVLGVEALARWQHPELGLLAPDEFVPVLEAAGQAPALTALVLDASLCAARGWLDAGLRLSVAVNVPVAQFEDSSFPDAVAHALHHHGVPPELLILELTESGVSAERAAALPVLRRLRGLGCRLSLDDFGTGQSSLAHLRGLPVDQVKIDKSFVLGMDTDPDDAALVRAIVAMAHTLGLVVVAEGVERESVRDALTAMGCDVAQGFGVSRALPAQELEGWLDAREVRAGERGPRTLLA